MNLRRKILLAAGIVLGIAILVPIIHHYQLRSELNSYIAQLKAKGEPMDLAQVIPLPLPPEQNGADALIQANDAFNEAIHTGNKFFETNDVYGMTMVAPGRAMIVSQEPDFRDSDGTFSWEQIADAVNENAKSIEPLQQLIEKPNFDFHIDYGKGFSDFALTNFYLAESKRAAQRLETAAMVDLHNSDTASAVTNVRTMLALSKAMTGERLLISELVSYAMAQMTLTATWELLQSTNVTDGQLAQLQKDWMSLDFIHAEENAIAMECVMSQRTAEQWRDSNAKFQHYINEEYEVNGTKHQESAFDKIGGEISGFEWRHWWSYPDELQMIKGFAIIRETASSLETNYSFQAAIATQNKKMNSLFGSKVIGQSVNMPNYGRMNAHSLFSETVVTLGSVLRKVESSEAARQTVIAAIALKRYQMKHGNYPDALDALVPEFISAVPLDPVDGQPLRYRLKGDGNFILYSIGENGTDDGGSPALERGVRSSSYYWQNLHALDWVWPQPASQQEIQSYYDKLSRQSRN